MQSTAETIIAATCLPTTLSSHQMILESSIGHFFGLHYTILRCSMLALISAELIPRHSSRSCHHIHIRISSSSPTLLQIQYSSYCSTPPLPHPNFPSPCMCLRAVCYHAVVMLSCHYITPQGRARTCAPSWKESRESMRMTSIN